MNSNYSVMQSNHKQDPKMQSYIGNMLAHWYYFVISVIVFLGLAFFYLYLASPQYLISSVVMLKDEKSNSENKAVSNFAQDNGLAFLLNPSENTQNELTILKSRTLAKEVVRDLRLDITVRRMDGLRSEDIGDDAPFNVTLTNVRTDSIRLRTFMVKFLPGNEFEIENKEEDFEKDGKMDQAIETKQYDLLISRKPDAPYTTHKYEIEIISENAAVNKLLASYEAEIPEKGATTVDMNLLYPNPKKGELILETLMEKYLAKNASDKMRMADSTLVFIDNRLAIVAGELGEVEGELEGFRSQNRITNIDEQARVLVGNANDYYKQLNEQKVQMSIIQDLENYLKDPNNRKVPSSLNINNASFTSTLQQYNELLLDYEKKNLSYTSTNPVIVNLEEQIQSVRNNLLNSIASYKKEIQLSSTGIGGQNTMSNSEIQQIPAKERVYLSLTRSQELKQQLYVYLMQKREEAFIARTSSMPSASIVDNAKSTDRPVKPSPPIIYMMSFMLGLIVPFSIVNAKEFFRKRLKADSDIDQYTDIEIIGKIAHSADPETLAIGKKTNTLIAENFRSLRTNLHYVLPNNTAKAIMITSSINGEGKTFMSLNLGSSFAIGNKKVVFLELDLRKPKLALLAGLDKDTLGFSDYVAGKSLIDVVQPLSFSENCYIVSAGQRTDNPAELLLDNRLPELINELKTQFDYVVIDSPPVGFVSDALIIQEFVDMTLYICRDNYTSKEQIHLLNELKRRNRFAKVQLVINDVYFKKGNYAGYGYGYGYAYSQDGGDSKKRRWLSK